MNILILSWRGYGHPNAGGAEQVTLEHAKGWVTAGHRVTLFTSFFNEAKREEYLRGVKIIRSGSQFFDVQIRAFLWYLGNNKSKFDLVIDEFHGIPFFTPLYVRARKLAYIHETAREVWKLNPWPKPYNLIPTYFGTFFEHWIFKIFYKSIPFMTVSNSTKRDLVEWGIERKNITVIHNGVNFYKSKKTPSKENLRTAMYLGAISEDKGTADAIRAFSEIERKDDRWQYWVVGFGTKQHISKLKKLAKDLGIIKKVKFWGFVSDRKKYDLLARAHILINPSVHEGWGLVNIEANSAGTPVIGYDVHGLRDSVQSERTGILVKKGDYSGIAESARTLVEDEAKYEKMRKSALAWSKKFTWEKSRKESLMLIESL